MSFSCACLILARHSSSSITSPTYSLTKAPCGTRDEEQARLSISTEGFMWILQPHTFVIKWFLLKYLLDVRHSTQAPAAGQRPVNLHRCILALSEGLVLTTLPCRTHLRVALVHQHSINALRVDATWVLVRRFTVTTGDLGQVSSNDLHLPNWPVYLRDRDRRVMFSPDISVNCSLCQARKSQMSMWWHVIP